VDDYETKAEFGATEGGSHTHQRVARVTVRVGDYKTDSSGGRGDGALQLAGLDDDPIAVRSALWAATDQAYKSALAAYAQKQAELKQVQTPPQADDFSRETPVISLADTEKLTLDETAWTERVARASGLYRTDSTVKANEHDVQYSSANFHARVTTTWLVTSEGAIVRKSASEYQEGFGVGTQPPMECASIARLRRWVCRSRILIHKKSLRNARWTDCVAQRFAQGPAGGRGVSRAGSFEFRRKCRHDAVVVSERRNSDAP